jgi:hypothetical protein
MGFAAINPSYVVGCPFVGWVEQRETHHFGPTPIYRDGFRSAQPILPGNRPFPRTPARGSIPGS